MTDAARRIGHDINSRLHVHHCADCAELRAKINVRGTHFDAAEMDEIANVWAPFGEAVHHDRDGATFQLSNGETFRVTQHRIEAPKNRTPEWFRGVMEHAATQWGGAFCIDGGTMTENGFVPDPNPNKEYRLKLRAYAQVYGLDFKDGNDAHHPLSQKDLAQLPALMRQIREFHGDAPPPRPTARPPNQRAAPAAAPTGPGA
jgi:hypothetical protein